MVWLAAIMHSAYVHMASYCNVIIKSLRTVHTEGASTADVVV